MKITSLDVLGMFVHVLIGLVIGLFFVYMIQASNALHSIDTTLKQCVQKK